MQHSTQLRYATHAKKKRIYNYPSLYQSKLVTPIQSDFRIIIIILFGSLLLIKFISSFNLFYYLFNYSLISTIILSYFIFFYDLHP